MDFGIIAERHPALVKLAEIISFRKNYAAVDMFADKISETINRDRNVLISVALRQKLVRDDGVLQDVFNVSRRAVNDALKAVDFGATGYAHLVWDTYRNTALKKTRRIPPKTDVIVKTILNHYRTSIDDVRMFADKMEERHPRQAIAMILWDVYKITPRSISEHYLKCGADEVTNLRRAGIGELLFGNTPRTVRRDKSGREIGPSHQWLGAHDFLLDITELLARLDVEAKPEVWRKKPAATKAPKRDVDAAKAA